MGISVDCVKDSLAVRPPLVGIIEPAVALLVGSGLAVAAFQAYLKPFSRYVLLA